MADDTTTLRGGGGGARALLAWVAILGLAALVIWLAADRNARQWHLVPDEGRLVVMKGIPFPVGRQPFKTDDPRLADAYAPIVPPPGAPVPPERTFEDRSALDQTLFDVLAGWAKAEIASGEPARLERGLGYLGRAEKLAGISSAQREELAALRAESGYLEAQRLLERASDALREAADKLRLAAGSRSPHGTDAARLLREVEPLVDASIGVIRGAPPPRAAPPAAPAPAPAPAGEPAKAPAGEPAKAEPPPAAQGGAAAPPPAEAGRTVP
ncbi:MAG TPA: hypothetical protein VD838_10465 [Anaeromyxobacteraceae bacterium]|nr:hypothetical protein [Anaeromyxobacteraceae bacterium]